MARIHTLAHPTRQDEWRTTVKFLGNSIGVFDKKSGGEVDSDDTKYYPGGMDPPITLGGRKTTGNYVLSRIYSEYDHGIYNDLAAHAGRGVIVIDQTPLDRDGNSYGKPITAYGVLKRVNAPDVDSESGTAAMLEIEVTITGIPQIA